MSAAAGDDPPGSACKRSTEEATVGTDGSGAVPQPPKLRRQEGQVAGGPRVGDAKDADRALQVFTNDFDPSAYRRMASDSLRLAAYTAAIGRAVQGRTVLDLGTGPEALLAILCARAGARRVVAVEVAPKIAEKAKLAVKSAGFSESIEVVVGYSTMLQLPRVDVVVHEIVGNIATEEGIAASLADLQLRPEVVDASRPGWSLPLRVETLGMPTSLNFALPEDDDSDVEVDPTIRLTFVPPASALLGEPRALEVVDASAKIPLQQETLHVWPIDKVTTFTGFICAPRVVLDEQTSLDAWAQSTHWRHVLVQLDMPVEVRAGDDIELRFKADLQHFPVAHTFEVAVLRHQEGEGKEKVREALDVLEVKLQMAC